MEDDNTLVQKAGTWRIDRRAQESCAVLCSKDAIFNYIIIRHDVDCKFNKLCW